MTVNETIALDKDDKVVSFNDSKLKISEQEELQAEYDAQTYQHEQLDEQNAL